MSGTALAFTCVGTSNPKFGSPKLWVLPGGSVADGLPLEKQEVLSCGKLPVAGSELYVMDEFVYPEAVIVVPDSTHGKTLVVTDSLINVTDSVGVPLFGRLMMNLFFMSSGAVPRPAPLWLHHALSICGKEKVQGWFDDIIALDFRHMISSHGAPALDVSHDAIAAEVKARV